MKRIKKDTAIRLNQQSYQLRRQLIGIRMSYLMAVEDIARETRSSECAKTDQNRHERAKEQENQAAKSSSKDHETPKNSVDVQETRRLRPGTFIVPLPDLLPECLVQ